MPSLFDSDGKQCTFTSNTNNCPNFRSRSERVSKTGVVGTLLSEAKFINLSLHCLEQVYFFLYFKSSKFCKRYYDHGCSSELN